MSKRKNIIVAITGGVAIVALLVTTGGEKSAVAQGGGSRGPDMAAQVQALQARIAESTPNASEQVVLAAIREPWRTTAVYDKSLEGKPAVKETDLRYTGYVELGSGRLAVVDGYEYQVGDELEGGGYKVVAISPDMVTLQRLDNRKQRNLPYQGQEASAQ